MKTLLIFLGLILFIFFPLFVLNKTHVFTRKRVFVAGLCLIGLLASVWGFYYISSNDREVSNKTTIGPSAATCPEGFKIFPEIEKVAEFDSIALDVSCGHRWGQCPNYSLLIKGNGEVTFEGKEGLPTKRVSKKLLSGMQVTTLVDALNKASFFSLPETQVSKPGCCYMDCSIDGNTRQVSLSVTIAGKTHNVFHQGAYKIPRQITDFENAIARTVEIEQWIGKSYNTF